MSIEKGSLSLKISIFFKNNKISGANPATREENLA
jgi:hypothetical protein